MAVHSSKFGRKNTPLISRYFVKNFPKKKLNKNLIFCSLKFPEKKVILIIFLNFYGKNADWIILISAGKISGSFLENLGNFTKKAEKAAKI